MDSTWGFSQPAAAVEMDRKIIRLVLLGGLAVAYGLFARFAPLHRVPVVCPFRRLTGVRCPLCGLTTSTALALRGDLLGALRVHPFAPFVYLGAGIWYYQAVASLSQHYARSRGK